MAANIPRVLALPPPPHQNQPRARTFNMSIKETVQNLNVVAGTLPVNTLGETLIIKLANDDQIAEDRVCPGCDIEIAGHHFSIPFKLGEFEVILGIDWLASNNAQIDCANKKVNLQIEENAMVTFKGEKQKQIFLTMIQTKRLLYQGCKTYLSYILDTEKESPKIEDSSVVCEFPDIFPDKLQGLPPDREI
ncbi:uncharacterized protein LOC141660583 [Apium graveolens]|uniref:uncharacterized protein LOC141660583 n=1 Tax=Apium graveolens TaxID=4045 RepID=UPI003D78F95A